MAQAPEISLKDKLSEVSREIEYRKKVYARLVKEGKMGALLANYRIDVLLAIEKTTKRLSGLDSFNYLMKINHQQRKWN